jgi:dynein heavy chain
MFDDTSILQEGFLEDINNLLNSGEIPNLLGKEEIEEIKKEL